MAPHAGRVYYRSGTMSHLETWDPSGVTTVYAGTADTFVARPVGYEGTAYVVTPFESGPAYGLTCVDVSDLGAPSSRTIFGTRVSALPSQLVQMSQIAP